MTSVEIGTGARPRTARRPMSWPVCATVFFIGSVILWADRSNFGVAAAVWSKSYGWTKSTTGLMLSAFSLGYLIMMPIGGWLTDRLGPRRTLGGCMAGWSIWVLCTPLAPSVIWLTAMWRVLLGAFEAPYIPGSSAAVARAVSADTRRGRFGAFVQSGAQLGPAVGVAAAGAIVAATGSAAMIFFVFGVIGLAAAGLWWIYARNYSDPMPVGEQALTEEAKARAAQPTVPYRKLITSPALWPLYFGYFALPYCQYIFLNWLPIYLTQYRHINLTSASYLSALPYLVAFVAVNLTGWGMDWFARRGWRQGAIHRKFFIALGALTYVVTVLIAANTESSALAVTMIIVANAGLSCYVIPYWTICTDMTPTQNGALSGLMNFCGIIGATLSPFVSGVIADATGAFVAPLELAAAIMVVAATTALIFVRVRPLRELVG